MPKLYEPTENQMIALKKKRASVPKVARNGISMTKDDGSLYKAMIDMAKKQMDKPRLAFAQAG